MATTILRLGLWILILVLALFVAAESFRDQQFAEMIPMAMLRQVLVLSGFLIAAGIVGMILERGAKAVIKNRCKVCKTPIPSGAIYCRAHLRSILHEEDDREHMTRIR
jgi:hypothetical protein